MCGIPAAFSSNFIGAVHSIDYVLDNNIHKCIVV